MPSGMNYIRRGTGKPLLLIHGLGGSWRTWSPILDDLAPERDVIAVDPMGARLVLELARRGGVLGAVVSLDPGGFWRGWECHAFYASVYASVRLVRLLQPVMPFITGNAIGRTLLFAQFSARPRLILASTSLYSSISLPPACWFVSTARTSGICGHRLEATRSRRPRWPCRCTQ